MNHVKRRASPQIQDISVMTRSDQGRFVLRKVRSKFRASRFPPPIQSSTPLPSDGREFRGLYYTYIIQRNRQKFSLRIQHDAP